MFILKSMFLYRTSQNMILAVLGSSNRLHEDRVVGNEVYSILDLPKNGARLWLGGFPIDQLDEHDLSPKTPTEIGLRARIDQLKLDSVPIGLWSFININNSKCAAARVG